MDIKSFVRTKRVIVVPATETSEEFWVELSNANLNLHNQKRLDVALDISDDEELFEVFELLDVKWNLTKDGEVIPITRELFIAEDSPIQAEIWRLIVNKVGESSAVSEGESQPALGSASMEAASNARPLTEVETEDPPTGT